MKVGQLVRQGMADHIKEGVKSRTTTILMSYSKISSGKMNEIRKDLKKVGAKLYVSRNTIAKKILSDLKYEQLAERLKGQMAFVWSDADSVEVSKTLMKLAKSCEGLLLQGGLLEGKILDKDDIKKLSDLPSRTVLLSMLLGTLQSPLTRLAGALNGKTQELIYLLKQLSEQKGGK